MIIDNNGNIGIGSSSPQNALDIVGDLNVTGNVGIEGTNGIIIPVGTTAQRVATQGGIRFNSTTSRFEGYNGSAWVNIDTLYS